MKAEPSIQLLKKVLPTLNETIIGKLTQDGVDFDCGVIQIPTETDFVNILDNLPQDKILMVRPWYKPLASIIMNLQKKYLKGEERGGVVVNGTPGSAKVLVFELSPVAPGS